MRLSRSRQWYGMVVRSAVIASWLLWPAAAAHADMELAPPPQADFERSAPEIATPPPADVEQAAPEIADEPSADYLPAAPEIAAPPSADAEMADPETDSGADDVED